MLANKKGNLALSIIIGVLGVILLAYVLIPMVRNTTQSQVDQDTLIKVNATANESFTLTRTPMEDASLTIPGLTLTTNYTINYTTAIVILNDDTTNASYTATYYYYEAGYLETASERALMAVVILGGIIGILYFIFSVTGVMGKV